MSSDTKCHITTLVAANASGNVIPPMHIYTGKRASRSTLLEGCVDEVYYGRSDKGWMTTKLYYGWLANHFAKHIPPESPVLLLADEVSKVLLPEWNPPLLLAATLISCFTAFGCRIFQLTKQKQVEYQLKNIGAAVTKNTFASVFKDAWSSAVKMQTTIHSFEKAGKCPLNKEKVRR